ncbi:hypothetical protein COEREDRAFT_84367 [Coemansia reversa NRRL 1564]|uniref:DUF3020 domain-containing protein n=1 Tax=Coemansia reversa (strain ATCC 12441 / NRRL 1564) TaxID=763665 RepID=A0A2G5BM75_COERN|nr:hypothetical protein COEREDRAFT_84367 [Coemansia reversa NRRL 1564]|eukprot:PIA19757.1 hypothetical protein COEREDRAFT_84367 [Coemansia reversa NRRL 1564]
MNQNPFAFFSADANGYPQLPESLNQAPYLDAHGGMVINDDSLHTSTMSHASHETDSNPSTPSGSKKIDRRPNKSKAEVSERMRRWRSENAEKNRLNDLRCRVYRQARIRFGKEPTPEREAWIQSEIFRRLERRRLREVMKGSGSVPAPTAITNPVSMGMIHAPGGPITRSRSTVHPFPIHMSSAPSAVPEHAMGFSASPYSMMAGNGVYGTGHSGHPYGHGDAMSHPSQHGHTGFATHPPPHLHQQHNAYMQQQHHGYSHIQQQQAQNHHSSQQHHHHLQQQQYQQQTHHAPHQGDTQLSHDFMANTSGPLPSTDIYSSFKFMNPLYPGRLLPSQNGAIGSGPGPTPGLYPEQSQQYVASQHGQQPADAQLSATNGITTHTVPSHQPPQDIASSNAAAVAAAAAAVVDFSSSFQLPQGSSQSVYQYYQDNGVPAFEPSHSSAETSNRQSHSSPSTPTDNMSSSAQPQYTLHAATPVEGPGYSIMPPGSPTSASGAMQVSSSSAFTSLSMVDPISSSALSSHVSLPRLASEAPQSSISFNATGETNGALADSATNATGLSVSTTGIYTHQTSNTSPSLNDVANNLFSLRQVSQATNSASSARLFGDSSQSLGASIQGPQSVSPVDRLAVVAAAAATQGAQNAGNNADSQTLDGVAATQGQTQQTQNDVHHLRHNMIQPTFSLGVVPDNIQFENYS